MARPLRIEFPGAWYHVMNRGARREAIFRSDEQRQYFLSLLAGTSERLNAEWHAYCLMDNHYHLMVRTPEGNLQRIMRQINGRYTRFFNRMAGHDGPLFRGRYKAVLVDAQSYWLGLSRYVHRNPLEAGMVTRLKRWRWSSYPAYIGAAHAPDWLNTGYILEAIGPTSYAAYVTRQSATDEMAAYASAGAPVPTVLGDDNFVADVLAGKPDNVDQPALRRARPKPSLDDIVASVAARFNVAPRELMPARQRRPSAAGQARATAMYLAHQLDVATLAEVAAHFGLAHYGSASSCIRSLKHQMESNPTLAHFVNVAMLDLTP
jgi:REP element-mobilizing transposase RayT